MDLPGEAATIMHKKENIGQVELATISFGQSFQITPIQMATTVSSWSMVEKESRRILEFPLKTEKEKGTGTVSYEEKKRDRIRKNFRNHADAFKECGGRRIRKKRSGVEGYSVGGKTATSQTLPRSANKYISSFIGFAPAENPQVLGIVVIRNPQGVYYGGTIAAPVLRKIFDNVLPYLGIEKAD